MANKALDLNKEVSLGSKNRGKMPTKTSINLVVKKESILSTRRGVTIVAVSTVVALLLICLLVIRPLIGLVKANSNVADLQAQLDEANRMIASMSDIEEDYAHYTMEDMTEEERNRVDRVKIMDLVNEALVKGGVTRSWDLSSNIMVIDVSGTSLAELNQIAAALEQNDIVERCIINSADKGTMNNSSNVAVSFVIYLTNPDTDQAAGTNAGEGAQQ